jgi:hypothetical protein
MSRRGKGATVADQKSRGGKKQGLERQAKGKKPQPTHLDRQHGGRARHQGAAGGIAPGGPLPQDRR